MKYLFQFKVIIEFHHIFTKLKLYIEPKFDYFFRIKVWTNPSQNKYTEEYNIYNILCLKDYKFMDSML
jgi:hypothetical protein